MTPPPGEIELSDSIARAVRRALGSLRSQHPERFYYVSLITTGQAHPPVFVAWSEEALNEALRRAKVNPKPRKNLKWSYADSPYFAFGEEYFDEVRALIERRPNIDSLRGDERQCEFDLRLRAMENAMAMLDGEGLFGQGADRLAVVVNVEVMPPDYTNTERAIRLNPPGALHTWLEEAAEMGEESVMTVS